MPSSKHFFAPAGVVFLKKHPSDNVGKFVCNGDCGFVRKPWFMLQEPHSFEFAPAGCTPETTNAITQLTLTVFGACGLPHEAFDNRNPAEMELVLRIFGDPRDTKIVHRLKAQSIFIFYFLLFTLLIYFVLVVSCYLMPSNLFL